MFKYTSVPLEPKQGQSAGYQPLQGGQSAEDISNEHIEHLNFE